MADNNAKHSSNKRKSWKKRTKKRARRQHDDKQQPPSKKSKISDGEKVVKYPSIPVDGANLLSVLLHPLDKDTFLKEYWMKKHYHVDISQQERVTDLLNGPFPFHLKTLLQQTASEKIHVWMRSTQKSKQQSAASSKGDLLSFTVEDYDSALSAYHCGGSLYFRSSQELADVFIPSLMQDLGIGIGSNYHDKEQGLRGEIEVFVSHKHHLTDWHTDFQHNFTIQLFGQKRWYLLPISAENSSFSNVYRGNTPHYNNQQDSDLNAKECQFKLHRSECAAFDYHEWKKFTADDEKYRDEIKVIDV
eukprot:CAMPEP_0197042276 /NCGR_PEP_ID=MMETSP1384-20130603/18674_1 /TAXON_ID=29189 /ORGANISM="Ammonia sp." /LENGTH=302 /DNA_ID=CAMNT_0042473351 /DNA_START=10 /DNA_END=914 /DNA_ORIENTATION=-